MNKDYTSDIKQVQRFMFDSSIYLLNMFQKKIDSFINTKSKKQRQKQTSIHRQQNHRVDINTFFDDPIKLLSRDLTKPIWNCVVKVNPIVYLDNDTMWRRNKLRQDCEEQQITSNINQDQQHVSPYRSIYNKLLMHFLHRYKNQHEDQSNFSITAYQCSRLNTEKITQCINIEEQQIILTVKSSTRQLFQLIMKCVTVENEFIQSLPDLGEVEQNYQYLRSTLQAYSQIIMSYLQDQQQQKQQNKQLNWFLTICMNALINILDCKSGATLITIQPKIGLINLLIHPLIIVAHNVLMIQFKYNQKEKQQRDNQKDHNKHHNNPNPFNNREIIVEQKKQQQKKKQNKMNNQQQQNNQLQGNNQSQEKELQEEVKNSVVFQQLKFTNCSRIAFINLDGYESQYNLDVVKYLSRYLMYVSFPKQSFNRKQQNTLKQFQHYKSERLLRKFFYQSLTPVEKRQLLKLHAIEEKDFKRNMFILPIHSRSLNQKYQLLYEQNGSENHSIQFYQSSFVKFMFEEIVMSHLRQYNPSVIVLSYSGKIWIQNEYWVQIIKQLTVISNFRLLFYPNAGKMFCFDEKGSQIVAGQDFFNLQQKYYQNYQINKINLFNHHSRTSLTQSNTAQSPISSVLQQSLDLNFLDKLSIFLKVSSGTYTLTKAVEQDSYIQKYKNYKIMRYSALLLKAISKQYPTIEKLKMRANQYLTISKVLKNNYTNKSETFDKLFQKVISKYHDMLVKVLQKLLFLDLKLLQSGFDNLVNITNNTSMFTQQQLFILQSSFELIKKINSSHQYIQKKDIWQDFKFQYKLQLSTQKTESRFYLHIPKFKDKSYLSTTKSLEDLIAAVEFQVIDEKERIPVELTASTKIVYSKKRLFKDALVYLINHIPKQKAINYTSFYGVLNQVIDFKSQVKIQLKPITIYKQRKLSQFQHFIDFNFHQTPKYIFLFWPRIFDDIKDKLSRILGEKYFPQTTWDIFRACRQQPHLFTQLNVINLNDYQYLIPRNGCTCYQPFQNLNRFYIFGGFYNSKENYLQFQNDVSFVDFFDNSNQVKVINLPKSFYITAVQNQEEMESSNTVMIKQFKNDFIRPRIQYQIYQLENKLNAQQGMGNNLPSTKKQVFLIGGVGQKFMRPFSLISYTGNKIIFQSSNASIESIRRIKTNNLLPVNLSNPTKTRSSQEMNVVTNAQNRNIYLNETLATQDSLTVSHYRYFYDHNQEKFDYQQIYQFADLEKKSYREETQCLRRAPTQYPIKYELMASSFRGKEFYNNFIKVSSQNGKKYIFELQLELSIEVKNLNPTNYQNQKIVRLTGASILAIDINASMLYCLIKHPSFTLDKCILAHFDINDLANKLVDSKTVEIHLKEIHKFDIDVSRNIIVVANSGTVAVLHGYKFNEQAQIQQVILKKYRKNQIKTFPVKSCQDKSVLLTNQMINKHLLNQISSSFFINQNSGIIICLTFKSIERIKIQNKQNPTEVVYLRIQRLDMTKDQYRWKLVNQRIFKFEIIKQKNIQKLSMLQREGMQQHPSLLTSTKLNYLRLIQIKGNKQQKDKKQKQFLIKAIYNEEIYTSIINIETSPETVEFYSNDNQTEEEYFKSIYKENIKQESIYLEKNPYYYKELKEGMSEINYEQMRNISIEMNRMELEDDGAGK